MESKKINWLYLSIILVYIGMVALLNILYIVWGRTDFLGVAANVILSELLVLGPALIFLGIRRQPWGDWLNFRRIKLSTFFMTILYTFLIMPLAVLLNAISMLFVENEMSMMGGDILNMPFWMMLFLIGIYGPFCEEFVFRGIIYTGYKKTGSVFRSIFLSALLFGLMHMNFNQAPYAIAIGIMFALLVEASGSLWTSVIAHIVVNSRMVFLLYLAESVLPGYMGQSTQETLSKEMLLVSIGFYLIAAVAATAIAVCVLVWISKNENREEHLRSIWSRRKISNGRLVSIPLIIAILLCLTYMIAALVFFK